MLITVGSSSPASVVAFGSSLTSETSSVPCGLSPVALAELIIFCLRPSSCVNTYVAVKGFDSPTSRSTEGQLAGEGEVSSNSTF